MTNADYYQLHKERILARQATKWKDPQFRAKKQTTKRLYRQRLKDELIRHAGGSCTQCGYNKCNSALDFHHVGEKRFRVSMAPSRKAAFEEIKKCILVCANCHREIHAGFGNN